LNQAILAHTAANDDVQGVWVYNDGGRAAAGFKGDTGDCVTRAIAIATQLPYQEIYDLVNEEAQRERPGSKRRKGKRSSARTGVFKDTKRRVLERLGWTWTPTMQIGQGCTVHLRADELPAGRLVVGVSRHSVAVIDGIIHDTHDPSRDGTRCVYGYWSKP
jgi:hypothetical protein